MKRLLAIMCCATLIIGCGSTSGTVSEAQSVEKQEAIVESEDVVDGYKNIVIGGFDARIPADWVDDGGILYLVEDGSYPCITYDVINDYDNLDALFSYSGSTKDFVDGYGERFDVVLRSEDMHRETYGSNTGLNFTIGGSIDDIKVVELVTLFSNPGGGVVAITFSYETSGDSSPVEEYVKLLYSLTPSAGLDAPSDSFQPSTGDRNALAQAKRYLSSMHFSRSGLIEQLQYEGYTDSECVYAVDNCGASWKEQAVGKAQDYLNSSSFSRKELIEQLEFEGFTRDQAEYGVSQVYD